MKKIIFYIILILSNTVYSQVREPLYLKSSVLDGVYIPDKNRIVKSKTRYSFQPKLNSETKTELYFYEKFDTLKRVIEELDYNSDGTLYSWSFREYDTLNNIIEYKALNSEDSSLIFIRKNFYNSKNKLLKSETLNSNNKTIRYSNYLYTELSKTYIGWSIEDSLKKIIIKTEYNSLGMKTRYIYSEIRNNDTLTILEEKYRYNDTILLQKVELRNKKTKIYLYNSNGQISNIYNTQEEFDSNLGTEFRYDEKNNLILKKIHKTGLTSEYVWQYKYDSLSRIIEKTELYSSYTSQSEKKLKITSFKTINYKQDYLGNKTQIITTVNYHGFENKMSETTLITILYDYNDNWLSTTETLDGELKKYTYSIYTYY